MKAPDPAGRSVAALFDETRRTLTDGAHKRFGSVPADVLAQHVLDSTPDADFAVREAALEALQRRWAFAGRDGLAVATRPAEGRGLGVYTTARGPQAATGRRARTSSRRRAKVEPRPYTTLLESLTPLAVTCDCPDYLRSSLGLCKHALVVLDDVFSKKKRIAATERPQKLTQPRLTWVPHLALSGKLDRMTGLRLEPPTHASQRVADSAAAVSHALADIRKVFAEGAPNRRALDDLRRRQQLLTLLDGALSSRQRSRAALDSTPAAQALVREELERAERHSKHEANAPGLMRHLRSLTRKLYPYQRQGIERFLRTGRLLLADDMGLGKTTQAIAACHALHTGGLVKRGIVIVPSSLKPQWLREWHDTTSVPASVVEGRPEERARAYRELRSGFLIISYEQLLRDAAFVQALSPEMVVLDEAQRIKNYATKSAVYVKSLAPEYRLVLTGTPMENRLEELASLLDWVDDVAVAPKWRLIPWYTAWQGDGARSGKAGARNLDTLRTRIAPCVVRRVRKEVLAQLPPRTDTRVPVAMTPQQIEEHDALVQPIAQLVHSARRRPLTQAQFLRLMQLLTQQRMISNGLAQIRFDDLWPAYSAVRPDPALLEGLFAPKLIELRRLITDLAVDQQRKVVVFSQWRRMLRLAEWSVRDLLGDAHLGAVFFTGAETPSHRTRNVIDFHDDPRVAVMFLSDAGGVGLNLQRAASACINLELPWNPAVLEQRIGRIYRLGQKRPIDVYNLVSEYGIESRIAGLVGVKQALFSGLFDGTSDEVRFDGTASFLTRIERLVDAAPPPEPPRTAANFELAPEGEDVEDAPSESDAVLTDATVGDQLPPSGPSQTVDNALARPAASTTALFEALRIERMADGGVRIEAPPDAAGTLIALFDGMARLLSAARAP